MAWLAFEKKPFQFWREIWIQVVVILLQLYLVCKIRGDTIQGYLSILWSILLIACLSGTRIFFPLWIFELIPINWENWYCVWCRQTSTVEFAVSWPRKRGTHAHNSRLMPSFIYSWSISHILEHGFFCLGQLGSSGQ